MSNWIDDIDVNEIKLEDLPEDMQAMVMNIADAIDDRVSPSLALPIAIKAVLKIATEFPGAKLYIPHPESLVRSLRDRLIKFKFSGNNHLELAREFNLTERTVRDIVNPNYCVDLRDVLETES